MTRAGAAARARARAVRHLRDARRILVPPAHTFMVHAPHPTVIFRHAAAAAAGETAMWLAGPEGVDDRELCQRIAQECAEAWRLLSDRADACDPWAEHRPGGVARGTAEWLRREVDAALAAMPDRDER